MKNEKSRVEELVEKDETVGELRRQIGRLERKLRKTIDRENSIIEAVVEAVIENPPHLVAPRRPASQKSKREEIAVLHLSDTQIGKITETYDTAKAEERVLEACQKIAQIAETRRKSAAIRRCDLILGGDMIEGEDIFPAQAHEIDSSVYEQACVTGPAILCKAILFLAQEFEEVRIFSVPGNHGRNGAYGGRANPRTNWDQVAMHTTRTILLGTTAHPRKELVGRVIWPAVNPRFWTIDRIYNWGLLIVHGHQIRGGFAGFPLYGTAKKMWGWMDSIEEPWDLLAFGHFHTPAMLTIGKRRVYANGTTESDNEYAREELATCGLPCQRALFFDAEHGVLSDDLLYLEIGKPSSKVRR